LITVNYKFLTLLSVFLLHTSGVLSEHAFAQTIKEPSSFVSNLGNLEIINLGGFDTSPVPNKITETPIQVVSAEPPTSPSPPTQNAPTKRESIMTDEELEFLLSLARSMKLNSQILNGRKMILLNSLNPKAGYRPFLHQLVLGFQITPCMDPMSGNQAHTWNLKQRVFYSDRRTLIT